MLRFKDGFDYLTAANIALKWDVGSATTSIGTGVYGKGKDAVGLQSTKTLTLNITTGYVGFHLFVGTLPGANAIIHDFRDTGTTQIDLRTDPSGAIFFTRNGTIIGSVSSAANRLISNNFYWIQCKVNIDATAGIAEASVNGNVIINSGVTNLNTKNTANSFYNQVRCNAPVNTWAFDSYHSWDGVGGDSFNGYIAETIIDSSLATGVGSNQTWTQGGVTHANNYLQVNEANEDGDTTYNVSSTPNQIDSFAFANLLESTGTVLDVAINSIDRIDDATPRVINHYVKSSASTALSGAISPSASYVNHQSFFAVDPNTGVAWTVAGRNAAEFGYKEIS